MFRRLLWRIPFEIVRWLFLLVDENCFVSWSESEQDFVPWGGWLEIPVRFYGDYKKVTKSCFDALQIVRRSRWWNKINHTFSLKYFISISKIKYKSYAFTSWKSFCVILKFSKNSILNKNLRIAFQMLWSIVQPHIFHLGSDPTVWLLGIIL